MSYSDKDLKPVSKKLTKLAGKIVEQEDNYRKWLYKKCKIEDNEYTNEPTRKIT
tara:strand:+ start:3959 stop:4120 length:162 start_codon:yes stop_codon:yes gene_type:complete